MVVVIFFFNDTATTEIYTLSLHDALPISWIERIRYECECGVIRSPFIDVTVGFQRDKLVALGPDVRVRLFHQILTLLVGKRHV